jgi:hypothetical protein
MSGRNSVARNANLMDSELQLPLLTPQISSLYTINLDNRAMFPLTSLKKRQNLATLHTLSQFIESTRFKAMHQSPDKFKLCQPGQSNEQSIKNLSSLAHAQSPLKMPKIKREYFSKTVALEVDYSEGKT